MDSITSYKNRALETLQGNWAPAAIATFFYLLISEGLSESFTFVLPDDVATVFSFYAVWMLISLPLGWGFVVLFLDLVRGTKIKYGRMFEGFYDFKRIFCTKFLEALYVILWSMLLVVPGIIKSLSYAMTDFVLKDNPELSNNAAINESMRLMEGHKMDLFLLYLSFIGWAILSLLTLGIGFFFLMPYMYTATAHFYEDLKAEQGYQ